MWKVLKCHITFLGILIFRKATGVCVGVGGNAVAGVVKASLLIVRPASTRL